MARTAGQRGTAIYKGNGKWALQATGLDRSRVSRTIAASGPTKAGARPRPVIDALAQLVAEVDSMKDVDTTTTFRDVCEKWLARSELADTTLDGYGSKLKIHIYPRWGEVPVVKITAHDLELWYSELRAIGLAPATIRQVHAIIRRVLRAAVVWGVGGMTFNPAVEVTAAPGAGHQAQHGIVSPKREEMEALLAATADDIQFHTFLTVSAALGTRRCETLALRWGDIDLEAGSIRVDKAINPSHRTALRGLKATKTHATATLAIGQKVVDALATYRAWCDERAADIGRTIGPDSFAFSLSGDGVVPWDPAYATRKFYALREKAGIGHHVQLKNLRHFHATQLLNAGVPLPVVAGRLRHASSSTTLAFYAKVDQAGDRAAAAAFDGLL